MVDVKTEVRGIKELTSALRKVDKELPKALKVKFLAIAGIVAGAARSKMPSISGRAKASVKPKASTRGASIAFGGRAAEYMPWLDFGGKVGRNRSIVRELVSGGRYVYPSIAENKEETEKAAGLAIKEVVKDAGFETRGF